jgi:phospholipid/cholesterol/gamma-HCH transport system substrate-binding protein
MKKDTGSKIRLGIFISLGIAVFMVGIYFIGERQQLFRSTFRVSGVFKDVGGLQAGNNVRLSGVNIGTIDNISIVSDTSVRVEIVIDESTRKFIKKDAVASIGSEGLMGNKILIINPGTGGKKEIEKNDTVQTVQPINLDDILASLKTTADNTSHITSDLATITSNIQSGKGTIGRLLMDRSMAQNIDSSIVSLKHGSEGLKNLINDAKSGFAQNIDSTIVNLKEGTAEFKILMEKAKKSWLLWGF